MYIYGVFRSLGAGYGILMCNNGIDTPALFGSLEAAAGWRNELQRCNENHVYKIYKFTLNPNGFTSQNVTYT